MTSSLSEENETRKVGPYLLKRRIGSGGMGEVFEAFDERLERPVALKQIRPESAERPQARRRFQREARAAARLNHPGIVKLHDVFSEDDSDWIVMELVEGRTLAEILEEGPLEVDRALDLALELATALAAAHAEGIVHRDLKAKNVLVTREGKVKILDFGLAKQVLFQDGKSTSMTADGQVLGTPHAMSPEQAMGRKVDLRSDLFSLGALFYELVSGDSPFRGSTPVETLKRVCTLIPRPLNDGDSGVPKAFSELVGRLLEKEPGHRPKTAAEVMAKIREVIDSTHPSFAVGLTALPKPSRAVASRSNGERRHVTVVCFEVVAEEYAALGSNSDISYSTFIKVGNLVREKISELGGHLVNMVQNQFSVCFGYPEAREDAADHAIYVAGELRRSLIAELAGQEMSDAQVRFGLHTGPAVVIEGDAGQLILGGTLDHCLQLQKSARSGEILVSGATFKLFRGAYPATQLSPERLPTALRSSEIFKVHGGKETPFRPEGVSEPLFGRDQELALLTDSWLKTRKGEGQVVLISGEAGIGKTRLVDSMKQAFEGRPVWLLGSCSQLAAGTALNPVIDLLRNGLALKKASDLSQELGFLEEKVESLGLSVDKEIPLLAPLLGLPYESRYPALELSPQRQRQKTLDCILSIFRTLSKEAPLVLWLEDLHWADPSTIELVGLLVEQLESSSILVLLTFRPGFEPTWDLTSRTAQLSLSRLTERDASRLVLRVTGGKELPPRILSEVLSKTDGIPLFIEELTKNLIESGALQEADGKYEATEGFDELTIPSTLRDSLTARLEWLGEAKEIAQLASAIGREFTFELLEAVFDKPNIKLRLALASLVETGLIHQKGFSSRRRYSFKHALIQDAAYESLLGPVRVGYHRKILRALQERYPNLEKQQPELLAHHCTEGGLHDQGIDYWLNAGQNGMLRSANAEAIGHLKRGLGLQNGEDPRELFFQTTLAAALMAQNGLGSSDAIPIFDRIEELSQDVEVSEDLVDVLMGTHKYVTAVARLGSSWDQGQSLMEIAEKSGNLTIRRTAHTCLGTTAFFQGRLELAESHQSKAIALDSLDRKEPIFVSPVDPGIECLGNSSVVLWLLGRADEALERSLSGVTLADNLSHPFSKALALYYPPWIHCLRREWDAALETARRSVSFCEEGGFPMWLNMSRVVLGRAVLECGLEMADPSERERNSLEGLELMREGLEGMEMTQTLLTRPFYLGLAIEGFVSAGKLDEAEERLKEALALFDEEDLDFDRFWEPELWRLKGSLYLAKAKPAGANSKLVAQDFYERAMSIARKHGAKALILRCATSQYRLWKDTKSVDQYKDVLKVALDEMNEGFSTFDFIQARQLLEH